MRAKLIVEGKEFDIDIFDPELTKLVKPEKKTGYEKVEEYNKVYYYVDSYGDVKLSRSSNELCEKIIYENSNYYSNQTVAENNARADKLMRQLRRFAVEHRVDGINWNDKTPKYFFWYEYEDKEIEIDRAYAMREVGTVYFDSEKAAKLAIETFHDELNWYFTEYKDSL